MRTVLRALGLPLAILAGVLAAPAGRAIAAGAYSLATIEAYVAWRWSDVSHISGDDLEQLLSAHPGEIVLIDVREAPEFAVSHLKGAIRVDPRVQRGAFLQQVGAAVKDKTVVLYCAVGVRSSVLARMVQADLKEIGARAVHNLRGGVFAWHNAVRPLVDAAGATPYIHPYYRTWSGLIERSSLLRTAPPH